MHQGSVLKADHDFRHYIITGITEAVPKYESGKDITDYSIAFKIETKNINNGQMPIILEDKPIYAEEIQYG